MHCGHRFGLAHPEDCVNDFQRKAWNFIEDGLKKYAPFDLVFCNGDAIDGNAKRNGGIELITTDRLEQCDMAKKILRKIAYIGKNVPEYYFTRGTPYHTGNEEDFENVIAESFSTEGKQNIGETLLVKVEGILFDLKHKIGGGPMPGAKASSILKEMTLAMLKEVADSREKADVFVRSHVHQHVFVQQMKRTCVITPALEINSAYGQRQCSGLTDFGFLVCEVDNGKISKWIKWIHDSPLMPELVIQT